jgi:predicted 3-demethylubiquinone-9 3-methyltransferase (glyoxalase superfamily)
MALNGGPSFTFAQGISLFVNCETQAEIDELWDRLSAGGEPGRCGWLKDKFGVSWQIIPSSLGKMLTDQEAGGRVLQAMLQMNKLDLGKLRQAYEGK